MSEYDNVSMDSDLDTYKNQGTQQTGSITFSGSIASGAQQIQYTDYFSIDSLDYFEALFDNSARHPGKFKKMALEQTTYLHESTRDSYLSLFLITEVNSSGIRFGAMIFNPYDGSVTIDSTTLNFQYIPYQATI